MTLWGLGDSYADDDWIPRPPRLRRDARYDLGLAADYVVSAGTEEPGVFRNWRRMTSLSSCSFTGLVM